MEETSDDCQFTSDCGSMRDIALPSIDDHEKGEGSAQLRFCSVQVSPAQGSSCPGLSEVCQWPYGWSRGGLGEGHEVRWDHMTPNFKNHVEFSFHLKMYALVCVGLGGLHSNPGLEVWCPAALRCGQWSKTPESNGWITRSKEDAFSGLGTAENLASQRRLYTE